MKKTDAYKILLLCFLSFLLSASPTWGERLEIPSSLNPVGSGARALGMGGAFIAVADDATAASWNPGGLIQLDFPEMSAVYGHIHRNEDTSFAKHPEASGSESFDYSNLNYLSVVWPFAVKGWIMTASLNYQHMYDFNHGWSYSLDEDDPFFTAPTQTDYEQDGALYALGFAYALMVNENLSLGITLNYWGDFLLENQWEQHYHEKRETVQGTRISFQKEEYNFEGWNAHLGFLWRLSNHWTVGGVFKTPFDADIERTATRLGRFTPAPGEAVISSDETYDEMHREKLHMPMSYGLGIAYRHSDEFTVSADVYLTHWEDFELEDEDGKRFSPISGKYADDSDTDPTTWFRLGAEYLYVGETTLVPFRAGIFYDPAPSEGSSDDYYGFSLGTGFLWQRPDTKRVKSLIFDIAYQFRIGEDVGTHMLQEAGFSQNVQEHTVHASLIVHF